MPGAQLQFPNARPSLCARGLWLACVLSVLCFAHAAAAANDSATAKTASPFSISKGPPPGFADLAAKQTTQADVYYGGIFLTSTFVEYDASSVEILDPLSVISMIPNVKDPAQLAALLSGPRSTNAAHLCHKRAAQDCGSLTPDMVDVLFDENRFRLDLFVSSTELLIHQLARQKYLPPSSVERSTLHNVRVNLSGTGRDERYTLSSESFYAKPEKRCHWGSRLLAGMAVKGKPAKRASPGQMCLPFVRCQVSNSPEVMAVSKKFVRANTHPSR